MNRMIRWFKYPVHPEHLQQISAPISRLAMEMDDLLEESAEKTAGLHKLLEAKDCLVRAALGEED